MVAPPLALAFGEEVITTIGRPYVTWAVRLISRATDPILTTIRRKANRP